jgi:predicted nucleotidyltransferase
MAKSVTLERAKVLGLLRDRRSELRSLEVRSLWLFGSVARDEATPNSDVDVLVAFDRPVGMFAFARLHSYLESLLGCKVDLGTPDSLKPHLQETVIREAIHVF